MARGGLSLVWCTRSGSRLRNVALVAVLMLAHMGSGSRPVGEDAFILSVTVDFPDDVNGSPHSPLSIGAMMDEIKAMGAKRVYWLYYGRLEPEATGAGSMYQAMRHGKETLGAVGQPLWEAVRAAHARGLEIIGVLKPYNGGMATSFPEGSPEALSRSRIRRVGGRLQQVIPFVERNPELRIQRHPEPGMDRFRTAVERIELIKADDGPTRLRPADLQIWVSEDNYRYRPLEIELRGREEVRPAADEVRDYYGNLLTARGQPVRVLVLEGLEVSAPYVVVRSNVQTGRPDFRNTSSAMIRVYSRNGDELPIVTATADALWVRPRDYQTYGLEFDSGFGHLPMVLDLPLTTGEEEDLALATGEEWKRHRPDLGLGTKGGFIAFARGKNAYLAAALCEAYPEVRALWLGWIDDMLEAGVDGIDLRVSAHGTLTDEPKSFGFNAPVLAEYHRRWGKPTGATGYDHERVATVRGDFYSEFVAEASRRTRRHGGRFAVHLHAEAFREHRVHGQIMGFPDNIEFQWREWIHRGWLDEATLRTSWFEAGEDSLRGGTDAGRRSRLDRTLDDPVAREMLVLAEAHGIPVHLQRYVSRAIGVDEYIRDLTHVVQDDRFAGFNVYEFYHLSRWAPQASVYRDVQGRTDAIARHWSNLRAEERNQR